QERRKVMKKYLYFCTLCIVGGGVYTTQASAVDEGKSPKIAYAFVKCTPPKPSVGRQGYVRDYKACSSRIGYGISVTGNEKEAMDAAYNYINALAVPLAADYSEYLIVKVLPNIYVGSYTADCATGTSVNSSGELEMGGAVCAVKSEIRPAYPPESFCMFASPLFGGDFAYKFTMSNFYAFGPTRKDAENNLQSQIAIEDHPSRTIVCNSAY